MDLIAHLRRFGPFLRRGELVRAGFRDAELRAAVRSGSVVRVRHGWYCAADTAEFASRVVRIGGRLTGMAALRARGLILPPGPLDIIVPSTASGLRSPDDRRRRWADRSDIRIVWADSVRRGRPSGAWLATADEALAHVLKTEEREIAIAACDAVLRLPGWNRLRLHTVFSRSPERTRAWETLVDERADAWGESLARVRLHDAGIPFEPQAWIGSAGPFDGRVSPHVFVEIDGSQHADEWDRGRAGRMLRDREKDLAAAEQGARVIRITYPLLLEQWGRCLRAIKLAYDDDLDRARWHRRAS